ncbi:hypothetical protein [Adlercreutzia equolifaciens]|uniref:hypothetical protein n=1 Tax=Adlercreutzia equolifaciens TaxID=446660 RepID=UPI0003897AC8|nr:hypothetical protein [Adlercreutzia equolifaciens]RFT84710.1 hypothetical protein DX903_05855 [Adlercreutzia equolifaciens]BAN77171.1 hypothetical protein AEQU_1202 [Adlercreutzia equolifaciens DSM 19450]
MPRIGETGEFYSPVIDESVLAYTAVHRINLDDFARDVMGMSPGTFSAKRRGLREFSLGEIAKLARITGFSIDEAVGLCGDAA